MALSDARWTSTNAVNLNRTVFDFADLAPQSWRWSRANNKPVDYVYLKCFF